MIVSWEWLEQYTPLEMSLETLTDRLTMTGLNVESSARIGTDTAIDLEVTSNRPDCLGHIGVAREISVLFQQDLTRPEADPATVTDSAESATQIDIECDDLCPQYLARIVRGVQVGPSPQWLRDRLQTLGIASVNNVVDVTNFVLMECGQPLHAFDLDKLSEGRIVVRRARSGEKMVAIDQKEYELTEDNCVIADAQRPVAIGGVMGGLESEICESTCNVLIETATFDQLSVRRAARQLNLHSPSSYRFERGVDR
ncbi:MAG: phenylalanine--tRNA ligase beta subunit-related protein, partial [Planctomycetaceae bacterium]